MDVAALNLQINSDSVLKAANDLDRFAASAAKAGAASGGPSASMMKLAASVSSIDSKLSVIIGSLEKMAVATSTAGNAAKAANNNFVGLSGSLNAIQAPASGLAATMGKVSVSFDNMGRAAQQADAHVLAYRAHLASLPPALGAIPGGVAPVVDSVNKIGRSSKASAQDTLNLTRQLADIGVTGLAGMSPFLIAIQQGPQLFDILQNRAVQTGTSIGVVFRGMAASALAFLAPLAPIIAALGLAAGAVAALTAEANNDSGLKKYTTAMGYTKAEVEKLNSVTVTFGDTTKAIFQVGFERIAGAFGISTKDIKSAWNSLLDFLIVATRNTIAGIYAAFSGLANIIPRLIENIKTGRSEGPIDLIKNAFGERYDAAQGFLDDVVKRSRANAQARQDALAAGMTPNRIGGGGGKSAAEQLADIIRNAEAEVKAEKDKAAAIGLTARAATELEQRTKLLSALEKAKIPMTDALRAKVDGLAKAYADAKTEADRLAAVEGVVDGLKKQGDAINDQLALVGTYGDALTKLRIETEALAKARDALPKGEVLTDEQAGKVLEGTKDVVRDQINFDQATRLEKIRKDAEDAKYALDLEAAGIGLVGASAIAWAYAQERLNEAKRAGIDLAPEEIAAIQQAAEAYGNARYAIDRQREALADAREVTRGFFSDWIGKVREGGNIFKSFADSVINSLNRIIDKLLDRTLNSFLDNIFSGSSGGGLLGSILGGGGGGFQKSLTANTNSVIDTGISSFKFANGGAFTNQIVSQPTLFRFANGGALGEMGEAGPEAIMPLSRGPDGKLGVQARGGGRAVKVEVNNYNSFDGAIGVDSIVALQRQAASQTEDSVKRNLQSWLQQIDIDGAVAT